MQYPSFNRFLRSWLHPVMRQGEQSRFSGVFYYLLGVFIVRIPRCKSCNSVPKIGSSTWLQVSKIAEANFLVFDAAVANLAIGDPMARYVLLLAR